MGDVRIIAGKGGPSVRLKQRDNGKRVQKIMLQDCKIADGCLVLFIFLSSVCVAFYT